MATRSFAGLALAKCSTGIAGLDDITEGGLPQGRPALICGGPGCGKTVLAMEFLVHGARQFGHPGLFVSFEESSDDLVQNFRSFGYEIPELIDAGQLHISDVKVARDELVETGAYSLDGLLIRLERDIERVGARRIVLDTLEALLGHLADTDSLRNELARLFSWIKQRGLTAVVTAERGSSALTRHGIEEYVSDCVLLLDHRVDGQISKRRLRVVKYRGSSHGRDEYPFLIGAGGVSVFPITSVDLDVDVSEEQVSSGVDDLDQMLGGNGYYRGSNVLISGTAGTGKSSLSAAFAAASCARGERCLYFAFEEPHRQIVRNMRSVGIDLAPWLDAGLLEIRAVRPTVFGLEEHLVGMLAAVDRFEPRAVVVDPITNFVSVGSTVEVKSMLVRAFDHFKSLGITTLITSLTAGAGSLEATDAGISSIMDTWIVVLHRFESDQRKRWLYVAKSRGMAHSYRARQLVVSSSGISLRQVSGTEVPKADLLRSDG